MSACKKTGTAAAADRRSNPLAALCHHVLTYGADGGTVQHGSWRGRALVPVLVFLGMVVAVVSSLGAPLIPTIAADYRVSLSAAQWSLTITLLMGAVATPTLGRLGDGPRRRTVILAALAVVLAGSILAAAPLGFGFLVTGRALQGVGLALTPLAIASARDALPADRSRPAVALLSITTVAGVGLGYPLTGLIAQGLGVRAGFWFGAVVSGLALVAAAVVVPPSRQQQAHRFDVLGGLLLGGALAGLLLALSQAESWGWTAPRLLAVSAASMLALATWIRRQLRTAHPLVDLRLVRHRSVLTADVTALFAGAGMYLLLSLVTRFVQTPAAAGYGFGSSIVVTGLVLLPFSMTSVAASRVAPLLAGRTSPDAVLPFGSAIFLLAMLLFAFVRSSLWEVFAVMAIAGLGVGCTFAAIPGLIVRAVPVRETGSAMSFNQVLRYVGYSTGSALSAAVLEAHTPVGRLLPLGSGYQLAALIGCGIWVLTAALSLLLPRTGSGQVERLLVEESVADALPFDRPAAVD